MRESQCSSLEHRDGNEAEPAEAASGNVARGEPAPQMDRSQSQAPQDLGAAQSEISQLRGQICRNHYRNLW